jgi:hypothetical protein
MKRRFQMSLQRLSAILFIIVFVTVILGVLVNAPGLYVTQDINARLQIIESNKTRWLTNQALTFIYILLTAIGFAILSSILRRTGNGWVPILAAIFIMVGSLSGTYFVYLQTIDPRGGYSGAYPLAEHLAYWFWLAGFFLFGIAFLQTNLPLWLGYLTAGIALIYGIFFLFTGAGFLTPFLMALLSLGIGFILLTRQIAVP